MLPITIVSYWPYLLNEANKTRILEVSKWKPFFVQDEKQALFFPITKWKYSLFSNIRSTQWIYKSRLPVYLTKLLIVKNVTFSTITEFVKDKQRSIGKRTFSMLHKSEPMTSCGMLGKKETTGSSKVKASHQDQMMLQHRLKKTSTKGDIILFRNSLFASLEPFFF